MNQNEELVYSSMGLDPILLLEEPNKSENYTVHIIRPGEEEGGVEEKNHEKIIPLKSKNPIEQDLTSAKEAEKIKEEEGRNIDLDEAKKDLISTDKISINEKNELNPTETKETDEDPRRKRRRSSASS